MEYPGSMIKLDDGLHRNSGNLLHVQDMQWKEGGM